VAADKARCLEEAAFHERTFNITDVGRKLNTFLTVLDSSLSGAAGIFQKKLKERLSWVKGADLAEHQRKLAYQYLNRRDFVRVAAFGWEAFVSRECAARGLDPQKFKEGRETAADALEVEIQAGQHEDWKGKAY
jgi:hypothetical protein